MTSAGIGLVRQPAPLRRMAVRIGLRDADMGLRRSVVLGVSAIVVAAGLGAGGLAGADAALAQTVPACGAPSFSAGIATVSCGYTGAAQSWTVPPGVRQATFTLYGAEGGGVLGGLGSEVTGTLAVSAGQMFEVNVGQTGPGAGSVEGAFNGGAAGGPGAGGGGGASDIRDGADALADRLLVAAGGGGGGSTGIGTGGPGGIADMPAGSGEPGPVPGGILLGGGGGGPGSQTAGGSGGAGGPAGIDICAGPGIPMPQNPGIPGSPGSFADGGNGGVIGTPVGGGGGGGGGYYGGGGGGSAASDLCGLAAGGGGGGGGSSYTGNVSDAAIIDAVPAPSGSPDGEVIITYPVLHVTTTGLPAATLGQLYGAGLLAANGTPPYTWTIEAGSLPPGLALDPSGNISGRPVAAGTFTFTALAVDSTVPAMTATQSLSLVVRQQPPGGISLSASPATGATAAAPVTLIATLAPVPGGPTPGGTATFTVDGAAAACGAQPVTNGTASCSLGTLPAGTYGFGVSYSGDSNYLAASAAKAGYVVAALTSIALTPSVLTPVFGQPLSVTATVSSGSSPVTAGSVQWSVDGTTRGQPVPVSSSGTTTLSSLADLAVGSHVVQATYAGTTTLAPSSQQTTVVVAQASTNTSVSVTASALTATVTAQPPGAGAPAGTVTFYVNGTQVGAVGLTTSGMATLAFTSAGAEVVTAAYGGDLSFTGSSASTATRNPAISAVASSAFPETSSGWYRAPVTVTFACTAGSAPLATPCPDPVVLSSDGAAQSVTETIMDTDGGIGTVTVSPINIDQVPPVVTVAGAANGGTYDAPGPSLTCSASDALSGLAGPCKLTIKRTATVLSWSAVATDKAGNHTTVTGSAALLDYFVAAASLSDGRFVVKTGRTYSVEVYIKGSKAPRYTGVVPQGTRLHRTGPAMKHLGHDLWVVKVRFTATMRLRSRNWSLGVLTRHTLHTILVTLTR